MKVSNERKEASYTYDLDIDAKESKALIEYAKGKIINDEQHLIEYAANRLLEEYIDSMEVKNKWLKKMVDKKKKK